MAAVSPGLQLCPHCGRPFKRLRSHLPHCKAAPRAAPSSDRTSTTPGLTAPSPGPAGALGLGPGPRGSGKSPEQPPSSSVGHGLPGAGPCREGKKAACKQGGEAGPAPQPPGPGAESMGSPSEEDVARCLDLHRDEVKDVSQQLSAGMQIVIENHRAKVVREKSYSRSHRSPVERLAAGRAGSDPDTAHLDPKEGKATAETPNTDKCGFGVVEKASASSQEEGKGSSLKAINTPVHGDPLRADCRSNSADLGQQETTDKPVTEENQINLEAGVEYRAPLSALHTKNLHLSVMEGFRAYKEGTSKNDLMSTQKLHKSKKQMAAVSEPPVNARGDIKLALHQLPLHTSTSQPIWSSQATGRSLSARALGFEWFPGLYPNYQGLSVFAEKPFQEDMEITTEAPKSSFSEERQGPLSEQRLMDVRLGELPAWLGIRDFSPQGLLGGAQKAWSSYYDKYINVKRGGPAGISMLLAGYCLLSYGWNYQHIKHHRWRKYH